MEIILNLYAGDDLKLKNRKLLFSVYASLLAAIVAVTTMAVSIPTPIGGYVNIGDGFVLLSGWILGPIWGALAAGIGSALADCMGYTIYAPATFVIKALMALIAFALAKCLKPVFKKQTWLAYALSGIVAELVMIVGYFVFEAVCLSYGMGALANILPNAVQATVGIVIGTLLMSLIDRSGLMEKLMRTKNHKNGKN